MQTNFIKQLRKLSLLLLFVLVIGLTIRLPIARAGDQHQTIPTAPPTTAIIPTSSNTQTPINPTATGIYPTFSSTQTPTETSQSTLVLASQTALPATASVTGTIFGTLTATEQAAQGTLPILSVTRTPGAGSQASPTPSGSQTTPDTATLVSLGVFVCLGSGIILFFVVAIRRYYSSRRK